MLIFVLFLQTAHAQNAETNIHALLNQWHAAAAQAQFENYFKPLHKDFIFMGTDATERWDMAAFKAFAKPYFDKDKAWSFTTLERKVYVTSDGNYAWFDELLQTQMKICRGSGVLLKTNNQWQLVQYVLSVTVPNDCIDAAIKIKAPIEDALIESLRNKKQ